MLRQTELASLGRRENSAEHSWHLAVMAIALGDYAPPGTDIARVIAMVLIHDLVEIDAGDLFLYAEAAQQDRQQVAEQRAADRIFALLPDHQAASMRALWDEFTLRQSADAKFSRALDRLQPMLENVTSGGGTWLTHGVTADQVMEKVELIRDGSPELGQFAENLVRDAVAAGILATSLHLASYLRPDMSTLRRRKLEGSWRRPSGPNGAGRPGPSTGSPGAPR